MSVLEEKEERGETRGKQEREKQGRGLEKLRSTYLAEHRNSVFCIDGTLFSTF